MVDIALAQHFIAGAEKCRQIGDLRTLLDAATRAMHFDYFALVHHVDLRQRAGSDAVALWTYPERWVDQYLERDLVSNDPVHLASHRSVVGFAWDDLPRLITLTPEHRRVREDTCRAGIVDGYTVPANIPGEANGSCSFAVAQGRKLVREMLPVAQLVGLFAFDAARRLLQRRAHGDPPHPRLSPRQRECLVFMARGATDRQTAATLGLARDTVTEYIDDARARYGAGNRCQLMLRAVWDGQVAVSDMIVGRSPI